MKNRKDTISIERKGKSEFTKHDLKEVCRDIQKIRVVDIVEVEKQ